VLFTWLYFFFLLARSRRKEKEKGKTKGGGGERKGRGEGGELTASVSHLSRGGGKTNIEKGKEKGQNKKGGEGSLSAGNILITFLISLQYSVSPLEKGEGKKKKKEEGGGRGGGPLQTLSSCHFLWLIGQGWGGLKREREKKKKGEEREKEEENSDCLFALHRCPVLGLRSLLGGGEKGPREVT